MRFYFKLIRLLSDRRLTSLYLLVFFLVTAAAIASAIIPIAIKQLVDMAVEENRAGASVAASLLIFFIPWVLQRILSDIRWHFYGIFEQNILRKFTLEAFKGGHRLSYQEIIQRGTGKLVQVISQGQTGLQIVVFNSTILLMPYLIEFIAAVVFASYIAGYLVGIAFGLTITGYIVFLLLGARELRKHQGAAMEAQKVASQNIVDSYLHHEAVKLHRLLPVLSTRLSSSLSALASAWIRFFSLRSRLNLAISLWTAAGVATVFYLSLDGASSGKLSVGTFAAVAAYILVLLRPLDGLNNAYRELKRGLGFLEPSKDLFEAHEPEGRGILPTAKASDAIAFDKVGFSYAGKEPLYSNLSFSIRKGEFTAIAGPSGSGKSTIPKLILGLLHPSDGKIHVSCGSETPQAGSVPLPISVVPQNISLLNDTIEFNISLGRASVGQADIVRAAKMACIHDFIVSLPDGYQTRIGEAGLRLSGGERQRVAIARALAAEFEILVLDEATSSIDSKTEAEILLNINREFQGKSLLIIAHRLNSIKNLPTIIVISEGEVVGRGAHKELLEACPVYRDLWIAYDSSLAESSPEHDVSTAPA